VQTGGLHNLAGWCGKGRKQFFFEKKNQKTFVIMGMRSRVTHLYKIKVFRFFFSKKKSFLPAYLLRS
jgi:hypothetical protein